MKHKLFSNGDTFHSFAAIIEIIKQSAEFDNVIRLMEVTIKNAYPYNFAAGIIASAEILYKLAPFEPDGPNAQKIRVPSKLLEDARGNCVDYTVFLGALALSLGLDLTLVVASYDGKNYGHIYPVINNVPFDLVLMQEQSGNEAAKRVINGGGASVNLGMSKKPVKSVLWIFT